MIEWKEWNQCGGDWDEVENDYKQMAEGVLRKAKSPVQQFMAVAHSNMELLIEIEGAERLRNSMLFIPLVGVRGNGAVTFYVWEDSPYGDCAMTVVGRGQLNLR
jgi:hypothetical protein